LYVELIKENIYSWPWISWCESSLVLGTLLAGPGIVDPSQNLSTVF